VAEQVKVKPRRGPDRPATDATDAPAAPSSTTVADDADALLDEIDRVLEENAWVERYVQKGGE
jgi:ubiquitin-like protein Pup